MKLSGSGGTLCCPESKGWGRLWSFFFKKKKPRNWHRLRYEMCSARLANAPGKKGLLEVTTEDMLLEELLQLAKEDSSPHLSPTRAYTVR